MNGIVTSFHPKKLFGFVEDEQGQSYFFHAPTDRREKRKKYYPGDEVEFEIIPSQIQPGKTEAKITRFLKNEDQEQLRQELLKDPSITGYLKRMPNDKWAIKHMPSKFFIELKGPTMYETEIEDRYDARENDLVEAIVTVRKNGKMTAVLADRKLIEEYHQAFKAKEAGEVVRAKVTGQNDQVVFLTIFSSRLTATIVKEKFNHNWSLLIKGLYIPVKILGVSDNAIRVEPQVE